MFLNESRLNLTVQKTSILTSLPTYGQNRFARYTFPVKTSLPLPCPDNLRGHKVGIRETKIVSGSLGRLILSFLPSFDRKTRLILFVRSISLSKLGALILILALSLSLRLSLSLSSLYSTPSLSVSLQFPLTKKLIFQYKYEAKKKGRQ